MVTLRARAVMVPLDVEAWTATAGAVLRQLRELSFTDGGVVHPDSGIVHAGLGDMTGTHPRPGTRYRLTVADPTGGHDEATITLVQDDGQRCRIRVDGEDVIGELRFADTGHPRHAHVTASMAVTGHRFLDGVVTADVTIELGSAKPITARLRHRRLRADMAMQLTDTASGQWQVELEVQARGRGMLRPVVAIVARLAARRLHSELQREFDDVVASIEADVAEVAGRSPDSIAHEVVCRIVDSVVVSIGELR